MNKISDKSVPIICLALALVLISVATYIYYKNKDSLSFDLSGRVALGDFIENFDANFDSSFQDFLAQNQFEDDGITKILIVPGHDEENYGAEFKDIKEEELNLQVAINLYELLGNIPNAEIYLSRDENGYNPELANYFLENDGEILKFRSFYEKFSSNLFEYGKIEPLEEIRQVKAPEDVSIKLHGINKWSNEQDIDIVVHIHFNDYPERGSGVGKHSGFSIYIPHHEYKNYADSAALAEQIREQLETQFSPSDLPMESDIIIQDSDLIAIGANNSLESAVSLIEYGYIYEKHFQDEEILADLAELTYKGIVNYLNRTN